MYFLVLFAIVFAIVFTAFKAKKGVDLSEDLLEVGKVTAYIVSIIIIAMVIVVGDINLPIEMPTRYILITPLLLFAQHTFKIISNFLKSDTQKR